MEEIVLLIGNGLTVPVALAVCLYLVVSVYPRLTLRLVWRAPTEAKFSIRTLFKGRTKRPLLPPGDRGIRKLVFPGGRAIIYEPAPKYRRYIRNYALIKQDGCTYIKCRIHSQIAHIRYDVAAFDGKGRLLDVLNVSERITEQGYTRFVRLPRATAYACVTLRKADGMYTGRDVMAGYSVASIIVYTGLSVVTAMITALILYNSMAEIFSLGNMTGNKALTLITSAVLGAVCAEWIVFRHYIHNIKGMSK